MWLNANRIYDYKIEPEYSELRKYAPPEFDKFSDSSFSNITISYTVGYWRKANAIHGWFVAECADGVDQCQQIPVFRSDLVELNNLCKSVMNDPSTALKTLPPTRHPEAETFDAVRQGSSQVLFGYNNIDIYYFLHIKDTISILDHVLNIIPDDNDKWNFIYQASW